MPAAAHGGFGRPPNPSRIPESLNGLGTEHDQIAGRLLSITRRVVAVTPGQKDNVSHGAKGFKGPMRKMPRPELAVYRSDIVLRQTIGYLSAFFRYLRPMNV